MPTPNAEELQRLAVEAAQAEWVLKTLERSPDATCAPVKELIMLMSELHRDAVQRLERRRLDA
jgi:hypothetical protein